MIGDVLYILFVSVAVLCASLVLLGIYAHWVVRRACQDSQMSSPPWSFNPFYYMVLATDWLKIYIFPGTEEQQRKQWSDLYDVLPDEDKEKMLAVVQSKADARKEVKDELG